MNKILFTATIDKHIECFHLPYLKWFKDNGFEVHVASRGELNIPHCDVKYNVPFVRAPYGLENLKAYVELKKIIDENDYRIIHCHTPMGGVVTRLAARAARKRGTKVLYTAHGFHFFKGAPLINWLLFYPVEKFLSRYTDGIITINSEDLTLVRERNFKTQEAFKIYGIGVNTERFKKISPEEKRQLREKYGYAKEDFILIYAAEFIHRKNHKFILDAMPQLKASIPRLKVLFAGRGALLEEMQAYAKSKGINGQVEFLGFRSDIEQLMALSDVGISSSRQEGLGLNLAEEMHCGLPVVAAVNRGHREMVADGRNGFLFEQNNYDQFITGIKKLYEDRNLWRQFSEEAIASAQRFTIEHSLKKMADIYQKYLA